MRKARIQIEVVAKFSEDMTKETAQKFIKDALYLRAGKDSFPVGRGENYRLVDINWGKFSIRVKDVD